MNIKFEVTKDALLKMCDENPEFEVYIQKAALNYIKNCRLKPIMAAEVAAQIKQFQDNIRCNVKQFLEEKGITIGYQNFVYLPEPVKDIIESTVLTQMKATIEESIRKHVKEYLFPYIDKELKDYKDRVDSKIQTTADTLLSEDYMKTYFKDYLDKKFKKVLE